MFCLDKSGALPDRLCDLHMPRILGSAEERKADFMYSRNTRRNSRRRSGSRATRLSLIAAGACVSVLVIGYAIATHGGRAVNTASVSSPGADNGAGGWGRGGYTMMPGPAQSA